MMIVLLGILRTCPLFESVKFITNYFLFQSISWPVLLGFPVSNTFFGMKAKPNRYIIEKYLFIHVIVQIGLLVSADLT